MSPERLAVEGLAVLGLFFLLLRVLCLSGGRHGRQSLLAYLFHSVKKSLACQLLARLHRDGDRRSKPDL